MAQQLQKNVVSVVYRSGHFIQQCLRYTLRYAS